MLSSLMVIGTFEAFIPDPHVVVIHMKRVYAPYLQQLWSINGNAPILPAHILARYNDAKGSFNTASYNSLPIGSGPFKVVAWERGGSTFDSKSKLLPWQAETR